jgi:hypothetical protein
MDWEDAETAQSVAVLAVVHLAGDIIILIARSVESLEKC